MIAGTEPLETLELEAPDWEGEVNRSSNEYVRWFQAALNRIDGAGLVVDGISGTFTKGAVRSFQSRHGLAADGIVGPITEASLIAAGAGAPPGSSDVVPPSSPVVPAPTPTSGASARLRVPESDLTQMLQTFKGYTYSNQSPRYPWLPPGLASSFLAPPYQTNCCCFVEALLWRTWSLRHGAAFRYDSRSHSKAVISDAGDRFSSVDVYVETGIARAVPTGSPPTTWCVVQGWHADMKSGHTFIVVARHATTDRVLILEANVPPLNGVGLRNFGRLNELPGGRPPSRWWESTNAPRWSSITSTYDGGVKLARLGVTGAAWSGLPG